DRPDDQPESRRGAHQKLPTTVIATESRVAAGAIRTTRDSCGAPISHSTVPAASAAMPTPPTTVATFARDTACLLFSLAARSRHGSLAGHTLRASSCIDLAWSTSTVLTPSATTPAPTDASASLRRVVNRRGGSSRG